MRLIVSEPVSRTRSESGYRSDGGVDCPGGAVWGLGGEEHEPVDAGLGELCGLPWRDRVPGGHADLELAEGGWPVDPVGGGAKAGERGGDVIGGEPVPVPAVRPRDRPR